MQRFCFEYLGKTLDSKHDGQDYFIFIQLFSVVKFLKSLQLTKLSCTLFRALSFFYAIFVRFCDKSVIFVCCFLARLRSFLDSKNHQFT